MHNRLVYTREKYVEKQDVDVEDPQISHGRQGSSKKQKPLNPKSSQSYARLAIICKYPKSMKYYKARS